MAPCVTSSWNRITVTRPDTFWQRVGKLLCTLKKVSPVIPARQILLTGWNTSLLAKGQGSQICAWPWGAGNPWCANHSFLLGFPWWMLSAWLLFLSASEPQGFSLVISSFLSFPSGLQLFVSSLPLKPYLVAGILTFTDRSLRHWGLSRPPRLASKTDPHIHPSEGHPLSLHPQSPGINRFPGQWAA